MTELVKRHPRLLTLGPFVAFVAVFAALQLRARPAADRADIVPAAESAEGGPVGEFTFASKDGTAVASGDFAGNVWVIGCFFTCCTTSCPQITASMTRLQQELADVPNFRLVSLTVDPVHDTPQKLDQYATAYNALAERWLFLRGDEAAVHEFVRGRLKLGVEANTNAADEPGNRVLHSPKLTLIDRRGAIRGYYDGTDIAAVERLRDAIRTLAREG